VQQVEGSLRQVRASITRLDHTDFYGLGGIETLHHDLMLLVVSVEREPIRFLDVTCRRQRNEPWPSPHRGENRSHTGRAFPEIRNQCPQVWYKVRLVKHDKAVSTS